MIKKEVGKLGEEIACFHLIKTGLRIIKRNYRLKFGEIDIIASSSDGTVVFCEVKTLISIYGSGSLDRLTPEDNLSPAKLRKMTRICEFFVRQNPHLISEEHGWRMDLIAINLNHDLNKAIVRHYKNI